MMKTAFTITVVIMLLLLTGLTASKLNQPLTNDAVEEEAVNAKISEKNTAEKIETIQEDERVAENAEMSMQPSQLTDANTQDIPEGNNQHVDPADPTYEHSPYAYPAIITSTNENIQTLENPSQSQDENANPPDGRIYYPTSSEEPYAYTPTYTPKETNMPIIPLSPEN